MPDTTHTILIVDDEPAIRRFLAPFLEAEGYRIIEAATGRDAPSTGIPR